MSESVANAPTSSPARQWVKIGLIGLAVLVGGVIIVGVVVGRKNRPPALTRERFESAMRKWEENAPPDYNLEVKVSGRQPATYRVQVRGGEATAAYRNDYPLKQRRTFRTWSVPGMFGTIESDVDHSELSSQKIVVRPGDVRPSKLHLWAAFDPQYGYPARYLRIDGGGPGDVTWEVTEFEVLTGGGS